MAPRDSWNGPKALAAFIMAAAAYGLTATLLFGDPLKPLFLATAWSDRLGLPLWQAGLLVSAWAAAQIFRQPAKSYVAALYRPAVFAASFVVLSVLLLGTTAELYRRLAIGAFGGDRVIQHSFFRSIREAPRDFQFFLHAAVLKDCVPYAWSYRTMALYSLRPNVAVNVLPSDWIAACGIERDRR